MMGISLRNTPIQRKLTLVTLFTSSFALFLMGSGLITYELVTFRSSLANNVGVLARIVGANSTAALTFEDPKNAHEILNALAADSQVTAAAIYDARGGLFASFPPGKPRADFPLNPMSDGQRFERAHLILFQPISQEGARLGTIYVRADLGEMYSRLSAYGVLLLLVSGCSFLGALMLSRNLQGHISAPILELAQAATAVSERQDYSVRAVKHGADEIGQLTDAFNQMLTRIGESNAALAASEERLRLALEGSQTGTWDWNLVTNRLTWDHYMYPLFGRTEAEFDGDPKTVNGFVHPDDRVHASNVTREALRQKRDLDLAFRILAADGSVRHMASRGRAIYDENGRAVRMSGVSLDVTESKRIEEDLSRAKEAAEAASQAKDNFLAILSHELRTPLTPVLAAVAALEEDESVPPPIAQQVEMIRRNVEVEARLIDDLLDVTGMVRGKIELNRRVVDVRPLLEHAMKNYCSGLAAKKDLRVSIEVVADQTFVLADSSRMTQVFWNLLQNACKFTPVGGAIDIRVFNAPAAEGQANGSTYGRDTEPPELVVEINDTGIGISAENMPRIFNAFEQGERSRTRIFGGLGLGLAISRTIVELHGGTISASSEGPGRGVKITLRLRTVPVPGPAVKDEPCFTLPTLVGNRALRVLLVEDHPETSDQLSRLLGRAGHNVSCASSLREAREAVADKAGGRDQCPFDVLISDLGLPDGSGHELMRELGVCHGISGIALSGFGMKEDIAESLAAGFARHMTKPVDWEDLKTEMQKLAERVTLSSPQ